MNMNIIYLPVLFPILFCSKCCIRGPKAPNKCGGSPLDSSNACKRPTSLSSLSLSALATVPLGLLVECTNVVHPTKCLNSLVYDCSTKLSTISDIILTISVHS